MPAQIHCANNSAWKNNHPGASRFAQQRRLPIMPVCRTRQAVAGTEGGASMPLGGSVLLFVH
jgi:hypothetical protein